MKTVKLYKMYWSRRDHYHAFINMPLPSLVPRVIQRSDMSEICISRDIRYVDYCLHRL